MTLGINDLASAISPPSSSSESCRSRLELELIALPIQSASCLYDYAVMICDYGKYLEMMSIAILAS